jgi:hypothetical protein
MYYCEVVSKRILIMFVPEEAEIFKDYLFICFIEQFVGSILYRYIVFGRGICEKYQLRDEQLHRILFRTLAK